MAKNLSEEVKKVLENIKEEGKRIIDKIDNLEIEKKYHDNIIYECSELKYYDEDSIVSEEIEKLLEILKGEINKEIDCNGEIFSDFIQSNSKVELIKTLIKITSKVKVVLTKNAWSYIESIDKLDNLRRLIILGMLCKDNQIREVAGAVLENKELAEKWCLE